MTTSILLVDDNPRLLSGARMTLEMNGYTVITASNGDEALQILEHTRPALIVSDILMPGCDGFALLEQVHARSQWVTIPFLFLTALNDAETIKRGRELGVDDYLIKPFSSSDLLQAVQARLQRAHALESAYNTDSYLSTIVIMAKAIEARDEQTGGHVERVAEYAQTLAQGLGWSDQQIKEIRLAATIHDVGKVSVPDAVLNKTGSLTPGEWLIMKNHPVWGCEILTPLKSTMILQGVRSHHERYDGQGYPDGLEGEQIPAAGRLLAIVDAYDAMTSDRPYRNKMAGEAAADQLSSGAGTQFDPQMVDIFLALVSQTK
jgi:putative two-component system response regulator